MTIFDEYMKGMTQGSGLVFLEKELKRLLKFYNDKRNTSLLIYSANTNPVIPDSQLNQNDFYYIKDLLEPYEGSDSLEIFLETPGGSGVAVEEIVRYIRKKFKCVSFVICGEAKSAGTIMAMSGDKIFMTDTASLGPIDAQMKIGRTVISAYDYVDWIKEKKEEAVKNNRINQVDAIILAQISPGELNGAFHALNFSQDLVKEWLYKYKFKDWKCTDTNGLDVTDQMKRDRASEIAQALSNHARWRTHGRSLKREDLELLGLKIDNIEENPEMRDLVYRIHCICRLLFSTSNTYKIIATSKNKISFNVQMFNAAQQIPIPFSQKKLEAVQLNFKCQNCGKGFNFYYKLVNKPEIDSEMKSKGFIPIPKILQCDCGFSTDMSGLIRKIENDFKIRIIE